MSIDVQAEELLELFAANLRNRRSELGLTQGQLVERINQIRRKKAKRGVRLVLLHVPNISNMERGIRAPHVENLAELAEALETTPDALLARPEKILA